MEHQVKLSFRLAMGVVLQGIRIRLGRSLVTLTGVLLGIAFLMASLTGQAIQEAVRGEDRARMEVNRMASFLAAEMGPPVGQTIALVQLGPLDELETRLLAKLSNEGLVAYRWHPAEPSMVLPASGTAKVERVALDAIANGAGGVLVMGEGALPNELEDASFVEALLDASRERVIGVTRTTTEIAQPGDGVVLTLARELRPDEIEAAAAEQRQSRFRRNWIIVISMLVTVVGIANAMLMSVTERVREIGTMKCLGALSSFIRNIFLIESSLIGVVGGVLGTLAGALFSILAYAISYGFATVIWSLPLGTLFAYAAFAMAAGVVLSVIAATYPARVASLMLPAHALRTNV